MSIQDYFPIIEDIKTDYIKARKHGFSRANAVNMIIKNYSNELNDSDDNPQVWIGLAKALCLKKELTEEIAEKVYESTSKLISVFPQAEKSLVSFEQWIKSQDVIGPEARYPQKRVYKSDWEIGDTFIHKMTGEYPQKNDLLNWYVVVRKVGEEFEENVEIWYQLVYLTLCKKEQIPTTGSELSELGYLPVRLIELQKGKGMKYGFLCQLRVSSKQAEKQFGLEWIGNFPKIEAPKNEVIMRPPYSGLVVYPERNGYDDLTIHACLAYKKYGIEYN